MKHNPAPWEYENVNHCEDRTAYGVVKDANGKILFDTINADVAEIHIEHDENGASRWCAVARANLTLASAAPDLLTCLQHAQDHLKAHLIRTDWRGRSIERSDLVYTIEQCVAAIAKAEGA